MKQELKFIVIANFANIRDMISVGIFSQGGQIGQEVLSRHLYCWLRQQSNPEDSSLVDNQKNAGALQAVVGQYESPSVIGRLLRRRILARQSNSSKARSDIMGEEAGTMPAKEYQNPEGFRSWGRSWNEEVKKATGLEMGFA